MEKIGGVVKMVSGMVLMLVLCAQGTITWEAHWNNGSKAPDTHVGDDGPWSSQATTPLTVDGGRGGSGAVDAGTDGSQKLNYPSISNVNLDHGTMSVWFKPKFSAVTTTDDATIVNVADGKSASQTFIKLYYNAGTDKFTWGSRVGASSLGYCVSPVQQFNPGDWVRISLAWNTGYSDTETEAKMYINGDLQYTTHYGHRDGSYFNPYALCVGNLYNQTGSTGNGVIDDLVFSDVYNDARLVPEPTTVALLAFALIPALRRRR